jgi:cellulose synthase/poly-beta-1,6-N-acetylglucosamine synthase-like glycosyltransferase
MTPEQLTQFLDELGNRLGPTGSHVFDLAVRYQIISSCISILLALATAIMFTALAKWIWKKREEMSDEDDIAVVSAIVCIAYPLLMMIPVLFVFASMNRLLNPEYSAIQDILSRLSH